MKDEVIGKRTCTVNTPLWNSGVKDGIQRNKKAYRVMIKNQLMKQTNI